MYSTAWFQYKKVNKAKDFQNGAGFFNILLYE